MWLTVPGTFGTVSVRMAHESLKQVVDRVAISPAKMPRQLARGDGPRAMKIPSTWRVPSHFVRVFEGGRFAVVPGVVFTDSVSDSVIYLAEAENCESF